MLFLAQFHTNFLTRNFKWLQEEDEVAKNPAFRCWQILVRYYLMRKDLLQLNTMTNRYIFRDYGKNVEKLFNEKKRKAKAEE
jgi:hypothetical protein